MRALVAMLLLAACNGGQGVDIEVHQGSDSIDSVELWLAYDVCKLPNDQGECDGIGWPSAQQRPSGEVYTLGEDEKLVRTDVIVDGVAQLHLEATPTNSAPYIIAVVGYHGGSIAGVKMLSGAEIPTDDQAHWVIELNDVGQVTENTTADPGDKPTRNALVWAREPLSTMRDVSGLTGCFAYQKWNDTDKLWETKYIVPPSDPDCDGDPPDCNPYWYKAPVDSARCVANTPAAADVCAVGKVACASETGTSACAPTLDPLTCVGSSLCTRCAGSPDLGACIKNEVNNTSTPVAGMPIQKCMMQTDLDGPCFNSTSPFGWKSQFVVRNGTCSSAVLRPLLLPFSGGMQIMTLNNGANVSIHAGNTVEGCQVDLTYETNAASVALVPVVVAIFNGPNQILIPVVLDFQKPAGGTCQTSTVTQQCVAGGAWPTMAGPGDSIFGCLR
jgi:hypothetical protein